MTVPYEGRLDRRYRSRFGMTLALCLVAPRLFAAVPPCSCSVDANYQSERYMRVTGSQLLLLAAVMSIHCHSSSSLSAEAREKLDPPLQRLVDGRSLSIDQYHTSSRGDTTVYRVLITTGEEERLREAGLPVGSVTGDLVTARLTITELRTAASLPSVRSIENPSRAYPSPNDNR